jgi:CRISPR/Cas system-associated exonuclease Cas4 (RecB family)
MVTKTLIKGGKPKLTAWSYSRWRLYEECPAKAYYKFIMKLQEPASAVLDHGSAMHTLAENFFKGASSVVPPELNKMKKTYQKLKKDGRAVEVELEFTFDNKWQPTGWFSKDAWCRIKIDLMIPPVEAIGKRKGLVVPTVHIGDHKTGGVDKRTGKLKPQVAAEYEPQFELYVLAGLTKHPLAQQATVANYFIDTGDVVPGRMYQREEMDALKQLWEARTVKMLNDTMYVPRPSNACRWCHYRKNNGGPCEY